MGKKSSDAFNPWPGFVDLFASVIMVVLIFMLVLIVNITYYAQFRYKVSYTGPISIDTLAQKSKESLEISLIAQAQKDALLDIETDAIPDDAQRDLVSVAGQDLTILDNNLTRQSNTVYTDWMIIRYLKNEIILDRPSVVEVEAFLHVAQNAYPHHTVSIFTQEPTDQTSASVSKQIALSRALNIRNMIRKHGYENDKVFVRLKEPLPPEKTIEHDAGYAVIIISK
ncbi:MAG: hypothetical protein IBX45_06580 [Campylobacterales bacterium]|nr:hypothetical protein [Campylobacterales bacterium]